MRAMHLILQQDHPDDFVVASGESHTVREFCELAFAEVGLDYRDHVVIDKRFYRPAEVESLVVTHQRRGACSAGSRDTVLPNWLRRWSTTI